ncbi:MAG TPA: HAMP domain-containing histidine kinase [Candidatus Merdisoma merdipullorum]|nr:HAMP domain-containing histidine kinase [Candidatus Merdisoma merdipullorum]
MKRWEYSKSWKTLAVVLNQICAVVLVLSVIVCTMYVGSNGFGWISRDQGFESTAYYQNEVLEQIYRCIRAASRESKFEKNGVYDGSLLVNVEEYAENNTILDGDPSDGGLYYHLTDLLNWSLDGFEAATLMKLTYDDGTVGYLTKGSRNYTEQSVYEDGSAVASISTVGEDESYSEESREEISELETDVQAEESEPEETGTSAGSSITESGTEETAEMEELTEGYWQEVISAADPEALADMGVLDGGQATVQNVEQIEAIEERYSPVGYESITAYAEEKNLTTAQLQALYYDLENIIPVIYNDFYAYKENLDLFSPSMTNMRYLLIPKSVTEITPEDYKEKIYTNIMTFGNAEFSDVDGLLSHIRGFRDYLIYDSSNMDYQVSNMPISLSELSSYVKSYPPSVDGEFILAIVVDPQYMASDNLQMYKQQYEEIRPLSRMAVYGVVLGGIMYLLTMVYLTMAAGRSTDEERTIRLNRFDHIKTEAALLLIAVPAVALLAAASLLSVYDLGMTEFALLGGGIALLFNLLFLSGYLSLVRRMKSKTLWANSVCCAAYRGLQLALRNRKATTKTLLSYGGFLALNILFLCLGGWGFFLAVVFDCAAGVFLMRQAVQRQRILDGIGKIAEGDLKHQIPVERLEGDNLVLAEAVNQIGKGLSSAVEKSIKDERLKSDLITNVSHDIKTPLTSIINYVDLLKREDIQNERAKNYIAILEDKALRLKHLTDDLVEASKISSGNVKLELTRINFQELINQTNGEFSEKFEDKGLRFVVSMPEEPVVIEADGRRLWRIIENLYNNAAKYAMPNTRVYVELTIVGHMVRFSIKNISEQPLNIEAGELTERFIRGDVARSTEGSGLGLSIAKNLTELQKGRFDIYLDGDLFKVTIIFPEAPARAGEAGNTAAEEPFHG